jgi:hypothetical protein
MSDYDYYKEKLESAYKIIEFYVNEIPTKIIKFLNEFKLDQSYIFLSFFLFGIILRLIIHKIKQSLKKKDTYIYNKPDNAENLYNIINKLTTLNENINKIETNKIINNNNNIEENIKQNNDNNLNDDLLNQKIINLEKKLIEINEKIETNYNDSSEIYNTINDCQNDILEEINISYPEQK